LAIKPLICGFAFVACLVAVIMAIPMISRVSPNVITQGVSPLASLSAAG
jgi:hypothetical protein